MDHEFDSILPPQLSLSTPELGLEPPEPPSILRRCVSSTELLYEKAMQRFYQAVQLEESEKHNNHRSQSVDTQSLHEPNIRRRSIDGGRISVERHDSIKRRLSGDIFKLSKKEETKGPTKPQREEEPIKDDFDEEVENEEDRDLKKEILESQRKLSIKHLTPSSSIEYEEDYTDSTASSASLSSIDSMEKFKSVIRTISTEKPDDHSELDTYHPMEQRILSSNTRTIDEDVATKAYERQPPLSYDEDERTDTPSAEPPESENEEPYANKQDDDVPRLEIRALSPYRTPAPDQSTIALTKPLPLPSPDFVPKPILKRPPPPIPPSQLTDSNQKDKKSKTKVKTNKTERKGLLQLFKKTPSTSSLTSSQDKLKTEKDKGDAGASGSNRIASAAVMAKKLSIERRQSSLEENKVAIDHYSDIVKEVTTTRKPKVPIYLSSDELKKAAEQEANELKSNPPQSQEKTDSTNFNKNKIIPNAKDVAKPVVKLKESDSRSIFAIKLSKDPKKVIEPKPELKIEPDQNYRQDSIELDIAPVRIKAMSPPLVIEKPAAEVNTDNSRSRSKEVSGKVVGKKRTPSGTRSRSNSALRTTKTNNIKTDIEQTQPAAVAKRAPSKTRMKSESKSPAARNRRPLHVVKVHIKDDGDTISQTSASPEPRSHTPEELLDEAEKTVKSTMVYVTDVAMLVAACWVYMFKDARLALPILALLVYRQAGNVVKDKLPKWMKRKSD